MKKLILLLSMLLFLACSTACMKSISDGFKPPLAANPQEAFTRNWEPVTLVSGRYDARFVDKNGEDFNLRADLLIEPGVRSRYELSYGGTPVALVIITKEFVDLINRREKYYVLEDNTPETSDRLVGLKLPAEDIANILSGKGFSLERFDQIYPTTSPGGDASLKMFHKTAPLIAEAVVDRFGRLRSILYKNAETEAPLLKAEYWEFRHNGSLNTTWPKRLVISLIERGDQIILDGQDIDINRKDRFSRLDALFRKHLSGSHIRLEDVPEGAPLLYRNLKNYADEEK